MKTTLYAEELLKKLVTEKELEILEKAWDPGLSIERKIELLVEKDHTS